MGAGQPEFDIEVRRYVYDSAIRQGSIPTTGQTAAALGRGEGEVRAAHRRMAAAHMLVLQPDTDEILMANPFSAVPTPFQVAAGKRAWYGNCIWDALGILAMLGRDGIVTTSCGCCGTAMEVRVAAGRAESTPEGVTHFAIPAAHWWDDIVFN